MIKTFNDYVQEVRVNIKEISIETIIKSYPEKLFVIDIREEYECESGMIPGAINISRGVLENNITNVLTTNERNKDTDIYLICRSGMRSVLAAKSLQDMGIENVYSIKGGMKAWVDKGLQIV